MEIKIKKLHPDAKLPEYRTDGAACFDLYALNGHVVVTEGSSAIIDTGLSVETPENHVMLIFSRSGHGFKNGVRLSNCVGVIDSDYRGEVKISLHNDSCIEDFELPPCTRIAQAMILPVQQVKFIEADDLSTTERGDGGFGHTDSKS